MHQNNFYQEKLQLLNDYGFQGKLLADNLEISASTISRILNGIKISKTTTNRINENLRKWFEDFVNEFCYGFDPPILLPISFSTSTLSSQPLAQEEPPPSTPISAPSNHPDYPPHILALCWNIPQSEDQTIFTEDDYKDHIVENASNILSKFDDDIIFHRELLPENLST